MRIAIRLALFLASILILTASTCGPPPLPAPTPGGGFFIETLFLRQSPFLFQTVPFVTTGWTWNHDLAGFTAVGNASPFQNITNAAGIGVSENGRVPSYWDVQWLQGGPPECINAPEQILGSFLSNPGRTTEVECFERPATTLEASGDFTFTPSPVYTDGSSGSTATIYGTSFSSQYGMPLVQYVDLSGNLIAQANASSVASDGTWATAAMPDVSQVPIGSYYGIVYNANASGGYDFLALTSVTVLDPPTPPDPGCQQDPRPLLCG